MNMKFKHIAAVLAGAAALSAPSCDLNGKKAFMTFPHKGYYIHINLLFEQKTNIF